MAGFEFVLLQCIESIIYNSMNNGHQWWNNKMCCHQFKLMLITKSKGEQEQQVYDRPYFSPFVPH